MRYSRFGIIAVLLAVEVFIAGAIVSSLSGGGLSVRAAGLHRVDQSGKAFAPVDAGAAPRVLIDDPDSFVTVAPSTDGKIHVTDASRLHGWFFGHSSLPALQVTRTADGVAIRRSESGGSRFSLLGWNREGVDVLMPAASSLDVARCSGADVRGATGQVRIRSVDGHIAAANLRVSALSLHSQDGSLRLDDVAAPSIDASTEDGSIHANKLDVGSGVLSTRDGSVTLDLSARDLTVRAHTQDGRVAFNGRRVDSNDDGSSGVFQIGSGGRALEVSTQDGSIHITGNGAQ